VTNLKKVNVEGQEVGEVEIDDALLKVSVKPQLIKDYVVTVQNNARQWSANSRGRSEIAHSNKKPHPQKGTGRARQGCLTVAQFRGGAAVFGPKPKFDQHIRMNKKERRFVIRYLLAQKILEGNTRVLQLDSFEA
jgi:large subunit ribosomal protein L4